MIHYWKVFDLEITDFEDYYGLTYTGELLPSQTSNSLVENIKPHDKTVYDMSLEKF